MIALERGRKIKGIVFALAVLGAMGSHPALAQFSLGHSRSAATKAAQPAQDQTPPASYNQADAPRLELKAIPVNPTDPIATVNGEVISRQQLADECVARKGEEILETLIGASSSSRR